MISYGQVNGRRGGAEQPLATPEDDEAARVRRFWSNNPGLRVCYVLGGKPRRPYAAAVALGFGRTVQLHAAYDDGPLWYCGEQVRRHVKEDGRSGKGPR